MGFVECGFPGGSLPLFVCFFRSVRAAAATPCAVVTQLDPELETLSGSVELCAWIMRVKWHVPATLAGVGNRYGGTAAAAMGAVVTGDEPGFVALPGLQVVQAGEAGVRRPVVAGVVRLSAGRSGVAAGVPAGNDPTFVAGEGVVTAGSRHPGVSVVGLPSAAGPRGQGDSGDDGPIPRVQRY
jgi:hypothetical protein